MRKFLMLMVGLFVLSVQLFAQNRTITGRVTDQAGNGVPNASVVVKGSNLGTTTTENGSYSLSVPATAKTLVISSVNFTTQEISIGSQSTINVQLRPGEDLATVVVTVPYGTIKKTSFTGSEATISAKTIGKQQVTSVTRALEGQIPGLIATNGGGAPGSGAAVMIRGVNSISSSTAPLYVLNGVPYDGSIVSIPTADIESVTVLKDASASALYGSRASNGVIMITTKKGRKGAVRTNAGVKTGFMSRGIPEYDRVGPKEYYELFWEAYRNSYLAQGDNATVAGQKASNVLTGPNGLVYNAYNVPGNTLVDPVTGKLNPNAQLLWDDSWEDALFRTALRTEANFNVSGGSDRSDYYLSANYLNEEGILKFSGYKRYNMRLNVNTAATNWLNTGLNVDASSSRRDDVPSGGTATTNPFYYSRQMGPIYPVWQRNLTTGAFVPDSANGGNMLDWGTPAQMGTRPYAGRSNLLGSLDLDDRYSNMLNANGNTFAEVNFLKDFAFKASLGVNFFNSNSTSYQNNQYGDAAPTNPPLNTNGGRSTKSNTRQVSLTANEILTWTRDFGLHNIRALAGHENYRIQWNTMSANSSGFLFPGQNELDNGTAPFGNPSSAEDHARIESWLGNINYDFNEKFLLSASYRTDGSSKFNEHVRWGDFYSAGIGYRISQEEFMSGIKWLNELKLKASYGEVGNEDIGQLYPQRPYYYATGTGTYLGSQRPVNPDLTWETGKSLNAGVDFAMFDNRLQGTIEYWKNIKDGLIFDVPINPSLGYENVLRNIGTMENRGVDVQLGYTAVRSKSFNWRIDLNLSHFVNELTKLPPKQVQVGGGVVSGTKKLIEGGDVYAFWLKEYAGVDASNGDALYYMDVLGADGKPTGQRVLTNEYTKASFYTHGSALPDFAGGLTNSFNFKNFELSALVTFSYGGLFYDGNYGGIMHRGSAGTALHTDILNRWQKPGDVTNVPRLQNAVSNQDGVSTRFLFDASYLNIKNINLSYNLPANISNRLHLGGLSVFGSMDNIHLFTAKKGMDPQRSFVGTSDASYTPFRTISFGVNVNLQ